MTYNPENHPTPTANKYLVMPFNQTGNEPLLGKGCDIMVDITEESKSHGFDYPLFIREDAFNELIAIESRGPWSTNEDRLVGLLLCLQQAILGIGLNNYTLQFCVSVRNYSNVYVPVPVIARKGVLVFDRSRNGVVIALDYEHCY